MKNKKIVRLFTAMLAVVLCTKAFAVPASAGGGDGEPYYTETSGTEAAPTEDAEAPEVTVTDDEDTAGNNDTQAGGDALDQLAELLDVSRQAVSKWERNEAMPEAEKLVRISRQFGVSTDYLLLEELEEPETASTTAPAAGLWVRVKQWYRNRGYLLAWVLAAWGVWNLVDLAVLAANTYQQAQDLENFAWVKYVQMVYIPTMIPHVLLILVSVILVFRGRQLQGGFVGIIWAGSWC